MYIVVSGDFEIRRKNKIGINKQKESADVDSRSYIGPLVNHKETDQIKYKRPVQTKKQFMI